jgi:branched-chain amino acid transport system ATP-binding protein
MTEPLLRVRGLTAGYGIVQVLRGLDLEVMPSEAVVILGANGAGKTTTLRALSGMIPTKGVIEFDGLQLKRRRPESLLRLGIAHVPQGRGTITDLTVEENLRVGASNRKERDISSDIDRWYEVFPRLKERREQHAGSMSGGEQQMLAIARAYMSRPRLVLLDEPSLGLAPIVTRDLFSTVAQLARDAGTALLIVEQNANLALEFASRGYVLEAGQFVAQGTSAELLADDAIQRAYLGA